MEAHDSETIALLSQDRLLRREAGDGWHPSGLHERLLGELIAREVVMEQIIDKDEYKDDETMRELWEEYEEHLQTISDMKEENEIGDPPPVEPLTE